MMREPVSRCVVMRDFADAKEVDEPRSTVLTERPVLTFLSREQRLLDSQESLEDC